MSIPILENALEVSVTALVFTVCRPPQVNELEMSKVHYAMSQDCYWKHAYWMPKTRGCVLTLLSHTQVQSTVLPL